MPKKPPTNKPFISNLAYVPYDKLRDIRPRGYTNEDHVSYLKRFLTYRTKKYRSTEYKVIYNYDDETYQSHIGLPIEWTLKPGVMGYLEFEDYTSTGTMIFSPKKKIDPNHPKAAAGQEQFVKDILSVLDSNYGCFAVGTTGVGKTPSSLAVASELGYRTLIVVPNIPILNKWKEEIPILLGLKPNHIAEVRGKGNFNMNAPICISTIHTVAMCDYPEKYYKSFGYWILDEVETMATEKFILALRKCYATARLGMTATPNRTDQAEKALKLHIGPIRATSKGEVMPLTIYLHSYKAKKLLSGKDYKSHCRQVSKDKKRTEHFCELIYKVYKEGRNPLIVSDFIDHLEYAYKILHGLGIPEKDLGLYTGEITVAGKRKKVNDEDIKHVLNRRVVLATYGKMNAGLHKSHLNWGMDLTPRKKMKQVFGRIRSILEGKPTPEWHMPVDIMSRAFTTDLEDNKRKEYKEQGFKLKVGDFHKRF
ncbi:DEAD/DEAH box helicase [Cognatishimia sp.]|uniref:DEAD/DEAH box helicase n=1 Tax=Cognatishimia sp. TaxID=2211648 RepID=UPI00351699ED|nr:DEAD/DEAH box helicase family protein [Cognatishimia sp.]